MLPFVRMLEYGNVKPLPASITNTYVGSQSFYALRSDGVLFSTGSNDSGQLGVGDLKVRNTWVQITTDVDAVYTGMNASAVIIRKGKALYLSGRNTMSTGNDTSNYLNFTLIVSDISTIYEFSDCYVKDIQVNNNSMMVLIGRSSDANYGALYSQGKGATLGQGAVTQVLQLTLCASAPKTIMTISASSANCFCTTVNANILAVGNNSFKQIADTTTSTYNTYQSATLTSQNVHCGDYVVVAIKTDGVYIRGNKPGGAVSDFTKVMTFSTDLVTARNIQCSYNTRGVVISIPVGVTGTLTGLYVLGQKYDVNGVVGNTTTFTYMYSDIFDHIQGGFNHYVYKNSTGFYISGDNSQFLPGTDISAGLRFMTLPN